MDLGAGFGRMEEADCWWVNLTWCVTGGGPFHTPQDLDKDGGLFSLVHPPSPDLSPSISWPPPPISNLPCCVPASTLLPSTHSLGSRHSFPHLSQHATTTT